MLVASKKILRLIIGCVALSQLAACAVMSKKQCLSADWQRVGYSVGADGNREIDTALASRDAACAKHGVAPDRAEFISGHKIGIEYFCDPYNAVQHGVDGRTSVMRDQVCPETDYPGFSENFRAGFKLYELNQDLYRANSHTANLQNRRSDYYRRLSNLKKSANRSELSDAERNAYQQQYNSLQYRIREISYELRHSENQLYELRKRSQRYSDYLESEYLDPIFEPASGLPSAAN